MKDKGRVSGDGSHEGVGDGTDNAGAKDDGNGIEAVLSEQEQPEHQDERPAEAISATTAGRSAERTVCTPLKLRYL